jgi:hypothetical protein
MSIFAKKPEWEQKVMMDVGGAPPLAAPGGGYGIGEMVQLLRSLPVDQNGDLVVRVVRATLATLNVRLPDIIDDANRKQKIAHDRIVAVHTQIAELERQLEGHRREITSLESELKELTSVKERLQQAEKAAGPTHPLHAPAATGPAASPLAAKTRDEPPHLKD